MTTPGSLLFLAIPGLPLLWAALALVPRARSRVAAGGPVAVLPALLATALLPVGAEAVSPYLLLGVHWQLDAVSRPLLGVTAALWGAAALFARSYLAGDSRRWRFDAFFHLTLAGNLGLIVASSPVGFYTFFAVMSLASYGLIIHAGSAAALRAGRVYIVMAMFGEAALITGMVGLAAGVGVAWPALGLGLAVKAGVLPLHVWLPLAHPVAPVPASAVLSGAMIKAGLLGWLRFPPPDDLAPLWGAVLAGLGVAGALYAALVGLTQNRAKEVLAYSSVSQMGVMTAAVGLAWHQPQLAGPLQSAVVAYAVHHALTKGSLFLAAGWLERGGGMPARIALILAAAVMAGLPATGGAAAKALLKAPLAALPAGAQTATLVLSASALVTALLMARLLAVAWPREAAPEAAPRGQGIATGAVVALALVVPLTWTPLAGGVAKSLTHGLGAALGPLLAAALVAAVLLRWRGLGPWGPSIPAGDLLALLPAPALPRPFGPVRRPRPPWPAALTRGRWLGRGEAAVASWRGTGVALLIVALALALSRYG